MVFYGDQFIKDGTIITLINDYWQTIQSQMITYDKINETIEGDAESQQKKVGGW